MHHPSESRQRLVLASGSPRRRELLAGLGLTFEVRPVDVDETPRDGEPAEPYVLRLAETKARAASAGSPSGEVILAADTIVVVDGELLGKPRDRDHARGMLARLSGRTHQVLTGVAVGNAGGGLSTVVEITRVVFHRLSTAEIDWYVASDEPLDKAGSYAVQGLGALFVERIDGNYSNVVGLPLPAVYRLLSRVGYPVLAEVRGSR